MAGRNTGGRSTTSSYPSVCSVAAEVSIVERCWEVQPSGSTPKAGLVIIHGGNWHSGWFGELGDLLSSPEYSIRVTAPDLPGHGLSGDPVPGLRCEERNLVLLLQEHVGLGVWGPTPAFPGACCLASHRRPKACLELICDSAVSL